MFRNIIEQCTEWQQELYINNFVDFQKAVDSIHRESLWKILRSYGIPGKITSTSFYHNFSCSVQNSNIMFQVKTGVRQGCVMSSFLFNLAIDWVMRKATENEKRGIRWKINTILEDLDFADDIALLSHTFQHIQQKTNRLSQYAKYIGLNISETKTEVMTINVSNSTPIKLNGKDLPTTNTFTYLGSIVCNDGGASEDIKTRIGKAWNVFISLNNVWKSSQYSTTTKLKLYHSCVLSTLLYGSECWKMTDQDQSKLSTFHTKCLRRILRIFWPNTINNEELLRKCNQLDMATILTRRWKWLGHVIRKDSRSHTKTALHWTPDGKRKRGRPKTTWRRTVEAELKK